MDGARNEWTGNPNGPDGEVILDIAVVAGACAYSTGQPAKILMVFAPNTDQGFRDAVLAVGSHPSKPVACGISWGASESAWGPQAIANMDAALKTASKNCTFCCASGDSGDKDGTPQLQVDFPGSSPYVIDVGGTTIVTGIRNGVQVIINESVWNAGGGAGGGGYSSIEPVPDFQSKVIVQSLGKRGCPDLAMNADPASGYDTPFGVIGGTSASAPLMAAYIAVVSIPLGRSITNADLYANADVIRDLVAGNNTSNKR